MPLITEWLGLPWYALVPLVLGLGWISQELSRSTAMAIGLLDHPNPRKIHARPVPLSGGPGIFAPMALAYLLWLMAGSPGMATASALALGLAFGAIFTTGFIDDLRGISARKRLLVQAGVAALLWGAGFRLDDIAFGGWTLELSIVSLPLTMFWFMGFMNTSNLMDGMDGLSGGMNLIALLALGGFGLYIGSGAAPLAIAAAALAVVFLVCNLRGRGKVFMGDSGSLSVGLGIAVLALVMAQRPGGRLELARRWPSPSRPTRSESWTCCCRSSAGGALGLSPFRRRHPAHPPPPAARGPGQRLDAGDACTALAGHGGLRGRAALLWHADGADPSAGAAGGDRHRGLQAAAHRDDQPVAGDSHACVEAQSSSPYSRLSIASGPPRRRAPLPQVTGVGK